MPQVYCLLKELISPRRTVDFHLLQQDQGRRSFRSTRCQGSVYWESRIWDAIQLYCYPGAVRIRNTMAATCYPRFDDNCFQRVRRCYSFHHLYCPGVLLSPGIIPSSPSIVHFLLLFVKSMFCSQKSLRKYVHLGLSSSPESRLTIIFGHHPRSNQIILTPELTTFKCSHSHPMEPFKKCQIILFHPLNDNPTYGPENACMRRTQIIQILHFHCLGLYESFHIMAST